VELEIVRAVDHSGDVLVEEDNRGAVTGAVHIEHASILTLATADHEWQNRLGAKEYCQARRTAAMHGRGGGVQWRVALRVRRGL
jgi:hypothetical protein